MAFKPIYLRHGALNLIEHGLTRGLDALTTLVLLWVLAPERFGEFALAQAWVAPWLLLFVATENVIYRDFATWKSAGPPTLWAWLSFFRKQGLFKAVLALLLSLILAYTLPLAHLPYEERVALLIWAFFWVLAGQFAGADREFLRLELKLSELSILSVMQRLVFLIGMIVCATSGLFKFELLSFGFAASSVLAALLATLGARKFSNLRMDELQSEYLNENTGKNRALPPAPKLKMISETLKILKSFSLSMHLSGVILNWVTTMDLYFLGMLNLPARAIGVYSFALKLANFSNAVPLAIGNLFGMWVGRKGKERAFEQVGFANMLIGFASLCLVQAGVFWVLSEWLLAILAKGRFEVNELEQARTLLGWILSGAVLVQCTYLMNGWYTLSGWVKEVLFRVSLPWGICSLLIYGGVILFGGPAGATPFDNLLVAAQANLATSLSLWGAFLVFVLWRRRNAK